MELIFALCLFFTSYSYLVYPIILSFLTKIIRNDWESREIYPCVTVIISAHNEENVISAKVQNALDLNYPKELIEIIVSSDGSTDSTNSIVAAFDDPRVVLKTFDRIGKTACLNSVVPEAKGDIVLFTDANSIFPNDLLQKLLPNFFSSQIGLVTGGTRYLGSDGGEATIGFYSRLELWIKEKESRISSCVGADGAVFAVRKSLYRPLAAHDINDFIMPLDVIRRGKRVVMDSTVYCVEQSSKKTIQDYRRQVRITTRTLWALRQSPEFLNVFKFGCFSFFLMSHKVIRLTAPLFFLLAFFLNLLLLKSSPFFLLTFLGFTIFLAIGLLGLIGLLNGRFAMVCKVLLVTLSAQFIGLARMAAGIKDTVWTPQR